MKKRHTEEQIDLSKKERRMNGRKKGKKEGRKEGGDGGRNTKEENRKS